MAMSRICKCYICEKEEITNQAVLPDNWAVLWYQPILICDGCLEKWIDRFGERPAVWLEGKEEITL